MNYTSTTLSSLEERVRALEEDMGNVIEAVSLLQLDAKRPSKRSMRELIDERERQSNSDNGSLAELLRMFSSK